MEEALALEQHRTKRNDTQLAVIMIDIDHFKQFNDNFGHDGGDAILRALGDDHGSDTGAIVKAADLALYRAKRGGRNQVVMFAQSRDQLSRRPIDWRTNCYLQQSAGFP